jgi:hypothetical protein
LAASATVLVDELDARGDLLSRACATSSDAAEDQEDLELERLSVQNLIHSATAPFHSWQRRLGSFCKRVSLALIASASAASKSYTRSATIRVDELESRSFERWLAGRFRSIAGMARVRHKSDIFIYLNNLGWISLRFDCRERERILQASKI